MAVKAHSRCSCKVHLGLAPSPTKGIKPASLSLLVLPFNSAKHAFLKMLNLPDAENMAICALACLLLLHVVHRLASCETQQTAVTQESNVRSILEHITWSVLDDPSEATNDDENDTPVDLQERLSLGDIQLCRLDEYGNDEEVIQMKADTVGDVFQGIHFFYSAATKASEDYKDFIEYKLERADSPAELAYYSKKIEKLTNSLEVWDWSLSDAYWFEGLDYLGDNRWRIAMGS